MTEQKKSSPIPAKILVVDDEDALRMLIKTILEGIGHRVWEAKDLGTAREILKHQSIDLTICDIGLRGGESGIDLLRELAPHSPDTVVIMVTGNLDTQTAINCLREGAFDYLLKPFSANELRTIVARVQQRQKQLITERLRIAQQMELLAGFPSENPNPLLRVASDGAVLFANNASQLLLNEWQQQGGSVLPESLRNLVGEAHNRERAGEVEIHSAGRVFSFAIVPINHADYVFLYGHDITHLKQVEAELILLKNQAQEIALHDPLTRLPNRRLLEDRLQQAIAQSARDHKRFAVAFMDLDYFKQINDTHGHKVGDKLLVQVADHLRNALRKIDTVARWGGDEMILLLLGIHDHQEANRIGERLKSIVQKKITAEKAFEKSTISMGIAVFPDDAESPEALFQKADSALYAAKAQGRNRVVMFGDLAEVKKPSQA